MGKTDQFINRFAVHEAPTGPNGKNGDMIENFGDPVDYLQLSVPGKPCSTQPPEFEANRANNPPSLDVPPDAAPKVRELAPPLGNDQTEALIDNEEEHEEKPHMEAPELILHLGYAYGIEMAWFVLPIMNQTWSFSRLVGEWVTENWSLTRVFDDGAGACRATSTELGNDSQIRFINGCCQLFSRSNPAYSFILWKFDDLNGSLTWRNGFHPNHMVTWTRIGPFLEALGPEFQDGHLDKKVLCEGVSQHIENRAKAENMFKPMPSDGILLHIMMAVGCIHRANMFAVLKFVYHICGKWKDDFRIMVYHRGGSRNRDNRFVTRFWLGTEKRCQKVFDELISSPDFAGFVKSNMKLIPNRNSRKNQTNTKLLNSSG